MTGVNNSNKANTVVTVKDLQIISEVSTNILSNLSLEIILQTSIDHIVDKYNFLGGLLFIVDNNNIYTKTIAGGGKTVESFLKVIGQPISNLRISIDPKINNFVVNAVINKQTYFSYDLEDFTRGVLNKPLTLIAKTTTNTQACIALPIIYHDDVLGVLYLCKSRHEDFSVETPILEILTSHIGIAINNAKLYNSLEKSALELKDNNSKLSQALNTVKDLRQQERDMMDVVGHELRNPITTIYGIMQLLKRLQSTGDTKPLSNYEKYIDLAYSSARKEIKLIETLLSATKIESNEFEFDLQKFDLVSEIKHSLAEIKQVYKDKPISTKFITSRNSLNIKADKIRFAEVIDNLLTNAFKYTASGHIHISLEYSKQELILIIEDTGVGIEQEDIANLGKKFFRAQHKKENRGNITKDSTGLGLYLVFRLVQKMGGSIVVNSTPGVGSTFKLIFKKTDNFSF